MAAYNGEAWIEQQIKSILEQESVNIDLLISVDKSTDDTITRLEKLANTHNNIQIIQSGQRFGSAARNFFFAIANAEADSYDYVALSDQDDIWVPDKLSRAVETLRRNLSEAYSSNVVAFWPDGRKKLVNKAQGQTTYDHYFEAAGPGCTYVLTRRAFEKLKKHMSKNNALIRKVNSHDWFIYAFCRSKGLSWIIDPVPSMYYRQHSANEVGVNIGINAALSRVKKVVAGWYLNECKAIAEAVSASNVNRVTLALKRQNVYDFLWLAVHAGKCRRRMRDKLAFCLIMLFYAGKCIVK
jgi:rhamnosyltransferase